MPAPVLYEEVQQFRQKWVEGLMLVVNAVLILAYAGNAFLTEQHNHDSNIGLLTTVAISGLITFLLRQLKLITQITTEGIQVRFSPVQRTFKHYRWEDIEQVFIRTYNPLLEYGGWGLRIGPSGSAYNVSGNVGLQLVLRGNYKILIGTIQPEVLIEVLRNLGRM